MIPRNGSTWLKKKKINLYSVTVLQHEVVPHLHSPPLFELSYLTTWIVAADLKVSHTIFIAKARIILKEKQIFSSDGHFSDPKFIRDQYNQFLFFLVRPNSFFTVKYNLIKIYNLIKNLKPEILQTSQLSFHYNNWIQWVKDWDLGKLRIEVRKGFFNTELAVCPFYMQLHVAWKLSRSSVFTP